MTRVGRLLSLTLLCGAVAGTGACTHDFRVRPAAAVAPQAAAPASASWSGQQCFQTLRREASNPAGQTARREATERLFVLYGPALLSAHGHTLTVPAGSGGPLALTLRRGSGPGGAEPSDYVGMEPADEFVVDHADRFDRVPGEGVPLVATLQPLLPVNTPGVVPPQAAAGISRALTIVASASLGSPPAVTLSLYDPRTVSRGLAADYTTPMALNLARFRPQRRGLAGLIRGGEYFSSSGLYALETATPDKTPLVLVHGLISDPGDFYHLENDLAASEEVRRRYQVWVFYYPTSLPVMYSAMLLREDVDLFIHRLDPGGSHPALHRAVLVGHSMGGLLARIAVSDGGDRCYHHFFSQPPDRLVLSKDERSLIQRAMFSPGSANVSRVVFIATPHRGSRLAVGPLGGIGRMLLHMPSALRNRFHTVMARNQQALPAKSSLQPGSSLDSLSPHGEVIAAVHDMPIRPGVHLHSIIGNRGGSGPVEKSSDGVVPYASSHLPQAESECIVPAGHTGTLLRPETGAELTRILSE